MEWHKAIDVVKPHIVKIFTPEGSGTGFLLLFNAQKNLCGIATAAHVISHAHIWEEPIRIQHYSSEKTVFLRPEQRAIKINWKEDTATILFAVGDVPFPDQPIQLKPEGKILKLGVEVGWLGFPVISSDLCFFSGRVSSWSQELGYLIDGVAISGVSGGPTLRIGGDSSIHLIGVVSAYIPSRTSGETLPGLCVVRDVTQLQKYIEAFKTIEEAKEQETPPADVGSAGQS